MKTFIKKHRLELIILFIASIIVSSIFLVSLNSARVTYKYQKIMMALATVNPVAVLYADENSEKNYEEFCSSEKLSSIKKYSEQYEGKDWVCNVSQDLKKYCVQVLLPKPSGKTYCVDSAGFTGYVKNTGCDSIIADCN